MSANKDPSKTRIVDKKVEKVKDIVLNRARMKNLNLINMDPKLLGDPRDRQNVTKYTKA